MTTDDRIVAFIRRYTAAHGYPPSVVEIAAEIGRSKSVTHYHLDRLVAAGRIARTPAIARSLRVIEPQAA